MKLLAFDFDDELLGEFTAFPHAVYADRPHWNPPDVERLRARLRRDHPFYRHGRARHFLVRSDAGRTLGRASGIVNDNLIRHGPGIGHVGFFECMDDLDTARVLLDAVAGYLRQHGVTRIWGPLNGATLYDYRLLTSGFDRPAFYTDIYNPPYYPTLFERCGFRVTQTYLSEYGEGMAFIRDRYARFKAAFEVAGFKTRLVRMDDFDRELDLLFRLVMEIFADNYAFSQMDRAEFDFIYRPYQKLLRPEHLRFACRPDSREIGFYLSFPDFAGRYPNAVIGKMVGLLPAYRQSRAGFTLIHDSLDYFMQAGFTATIASLRIHNNPSRRFGRERLGGFKEYALYERRLDGAPEA